MFCWFSSLINVKREIFMLTFGPKIWLYFLFPRLNICPILQENLSGLGTNFPRSCFLTQYCGVGGIEKPYLALQLHNTLSGFTIIFLESFFITQYIVVGATERKHRKILKFGQNLEVWSKTWNLVAILKFASILKFGGKPEIWCKSWNLVKILKFGQNSEIW